MFFVNRAQQICDYVRKSPNFLVGLRTISNSVDCSVSIIIKDPITLKEISVELITTNK